MTAAELTEFIASLRQEFSDAYEAARVASTHAVVVMRRLVLAEALLDTFTGTPEMLPTELPDLPVRSRIATSAVELPQPMSHSLAMSHSLGKPRGRKPAIPWEILADIWNTAVDEQRSPYKALADAAAERGIAESTSKNWAARLRERGLIRQAVPPNSPAPPAPDTAKSSDRSSGPALSKTIPDSPVPAMEWDLPARRREREEAPEMPRRASPRAHALSGIAL